MAGELKYFLPVGNAGPATKLEPTTAVPVPTRVSMTDVRRMTPAPQSVAVLPSVGLARAPVQRLEAGVSAAQGAATPGLAYPGKVYPKYPPFPPCDDVVAWDKLLKDEAKGVYGPVDALGGPAHNHMCVQCIGVERSQAATKAFGNTVCQGLHVDYVPTEWESGEDAGGLWIGKWGKGATKTTPPGYDSGYTRMCRDTIWMKGADGVYKQVIVKSYPCHSTAQETLGATCAGEGRCSFDDALSRQIHTAITKYLNEKASLPTIRKVLASFFITELCKLTDWEISIHGDVEYVHASTSITVKARIYPSLRACFKLAKGAPTWLLPSCITLSYDQINKALTDPKVTALLSLYTKELMVCIEDRNTGQQAACAVDPPIDPSTGKSGTKSAYAEAQLTWSLDPASAALYKAYDRVPAFRAVFFGHRIDTAMSYCRQLQLPQYLVGYVTNKHSSFAWQNNLESQQKQFFKWLGYPYGL